MAKNPDFRWQTAPAKPLHVRVFRYFFPLRGIKLPADGVTRAVKLRNRKVL